jgi:uncharacterized membrane protein YccC
MLARLLLNPWFLAAAAGALAAFLIWDEGRDWQREKALSDAVRAAEEASVRVGEFLTEERERNLQLIDSLSELADVPDTQTCGPAVGRALDILRQ